MNPNVRKPNETQEAFRSRRLEENKFEKVYLKGRLVWNSKKQGTYVKEEADVVTNIIEKVKNAS